MLWFTMMIFLWQYAYEIIDDYEICNLLTSYQRYSCYSSPFLIFSFGLSLLRIFVRLFFVIWISSCLRLNLVIVFETFFNFFFESHSSSHDEYFFHFTRYTFLILLLTFKIFSTFHFSWSSTSFVLIDVVVALLLL